MTEKLSVLIERARAVKMSLSEQEEQRRSFAYGNTKIENDRITREIVDEAAEALKRTKGD
jgi:predicted ATP-grasp superfamily ATP-dependent carboligase